MNFTDALARSLLERDDPVVTDYDFYVIGQHLFDERVYDGEPLKWVPAEWTPKKAYSAVRRLAARGVLAPDKDFHSSTWALSLIHI